MTIRAAFIAFFLSATASVILIAQEPNASVRSYPWTSVRDRFLEITANEDWIQDRGKIKEILDLQEGENVALDRMVREKRSVRREWGEAYVEFTATELGSAMERILTEQPSKRALTVAVRMAYNPGSEFAGLIAKRASDSIDVLTDFSKDPQEYQQAKAASILHFLVSDDVGRTKLSRADHASVVNALVRLTRGGSAFGRAEAAIALGFLDTPESVRALEQLERSDTSDSGHGRGLTVSDVARDSLARMRLKR